MKVAVSPRERQIKQLRSQLVQRLESQRYEVEQNATIKGKSGAEHGFNILARKSHDFIAYTIAVGIITHDDNQGISLGEVFAFDDKCYDCGIQAKVLIALPELDSVATRFAQGQRVKVFEEESLKTLLASPPPTSPAKESQFNWQTKAKFLESLAKSGYNAEETVKVTGKSGAEYVFDILASLDDGFIAHKLGIDIISSNELSLNQVSLFDTKTYDTGIYNKVMLISGEFTK